MKLNNKKIFLCITFFAATIALSGCKMLSRQKPQETTVPNDYFAEVQEPQAPILRTLNGANELDLETPLRCNVNWKTQEMVLTLPYNNSFFKFERNGLNNKLPRFEVVNFSFDEMPAEQALLKLTKEAGITLTAKDAPYTKISGTGISGEFSAVVDMIAEKAEFYYSYDSSKKVMTLSRKTNFTLYAPHSRTILLSLLDVIRGSGITDITTDWSDYSLTFDADFELQQKMENLVQTFEDNPTMIAYDVNVFRIYPNNDCKEIEWKKMLKEFDFGTITTAKTSVIGRVLTTTDELNIETLRAFLGGQASVVQISEGKFVVPSEWFARFDVGKCTDKDIKEADLSILGRATLQKDNRIFSEITLESSQGQISQFNVRSRLGDNFVIIGIPNAIFGENAPKSETVIFMVPRIIRTLKTSEPIKNKL